MAQFKDITEAAFEAALKKVVKPDTHHTLGKCNNAMKKVCAELGLNPTEVSSNVKDYIALRDMVYDYSEKVAK